jgi:hypothetical protein
MPEYRPPQRVVPARILTPSGWIQGSFHVPRMQSFVEFLSQPSRFFTLTGVVLGASKRQVPFLALRRSAAAIVVPACDERRLLLAQEPPNAALRDVTCVLDVGTVSGRLRVPPHLRVSDYLAHGAGFLLLRAADVGGAAAPIVLINASGLVAVSDVRPSAPAEEPAHTAADAGAEAAAPVAAVANA